MKSSAIIYVPSDTPEAMALATLRVAGVPLIVRSIMTLASAGIDGCTLLIAASQRHKIESFLERYNDKRLPLIQIISYDEPYRVSPAIVRNIADTTTKRMLLINANFLFEKSMVSEMRSMPIEDDEVVLCEEGAHRCPVIDTSQGVWKKLESFTKEKPRSIESCLGHLTEVATTRVAKLPAESNTFLLKSIRDRAVAEKSLAEAIRHRAPGPIAVHINKRISLPVSLFLSKLWISPNSITAFNIVIGLFSGVFVADGHRYEVILFGAVLFQIASIVDGCDGEVAKLTFRYTKFGQYADSLSDNLSLGSFLTGLIAGYWRSTHSPLAFYVGAIMLTTTAITLFWMIRYLVKNTQSASLATFDKDYLAKLKTGPKFLLTFIRFGKYTLKKDVFSFCFLVFAVAGILYWWLFITAFGTTLAAIILTYLNIQAWRTSRDKRFAEAGMQSEGQSA
ncbi:MAG: CDP-alcohol phosphatidyltransferase family protein [Pseudomonadota bacterium]